MATHTLRLVALTAAAGLLLAACGAADSTDPSGEDTASIQQRLDADNGNFSETDEVMAFEPADIYLPATFDYQTDTLADAAKQIIAIPELPDGLDEVNTSGSAAAGSQTSTTTRPADPTVRPEPAPKLCARALFKGKWKALRDGHGVFRGVIVNRNGRTIGFGKGIYGRHHFFGKLVHKGGKAWGLMKGIYGRGHFKGHIKVRGGAHGLLRGRILPGHRFAGVISTRCAPQPPPCRKPAVLDMCPARVRVCRQVTVRVGAQIAGANGGTATRAKSVTRTVCKVRCAPPVCRKPKPRPTPAPRPSSAGSTPNAAGSR